MTILEGKAVLADHLSQPTAFLSGQSSGKADIATGAIEHFREIGALERHHRSLLGFVEALECQGAIVPSQAPGCIDTSRGLDPQFRAVRGQEDAVNEILELSYVSRPRMLLK